MKVATPLSLCRTLDASSVPDEKPGADDAARSPDFLGRLPVPLRRPFKAGLDKTVARHLAASGERLACRTLAGADWHTSFDRLSTLPAERLPAMLATTLHSDLFAPALLSHYTPTQASPALPLHPACEAAGLRDERGIFQSFALVPFVFLIDEKRLKGRPAPRRWDDLLDPMWADEIVFGGWRHDEDSAYQDYNAYLLLCLYREYGEAGLVAFSANVRHLQHNIRTATQTGSNSRQVGAIAILPWLQAELCPRRERTRVVWPEDGALIMPISWLVKRGAEEKAAPLAAYLAGAELGAMLTRNAYPPTLLAAGAADAYPDNICLKWPGWEYFHGGSMAEDSATAAAIFFTAWYARHEPHTLEMTCSS
ncbi:MAG: ABC transporter substrate-binding protein [Zoogloeaceae bacterium]|nr:ABC transporter substrate-binding protein [Zoogloeaceae bacterium]